MAKKLCCIIFFITVLLQTARASTNGQTLLHWNQTEYDAILEPPIINSDCEYYQICNKVQNYPMELVTSLLEQLKAKNIRKFTTETLQADSGDYENLCSFKEEVYYPRAAKDSEGKWHFILNGHSQAFQGFVVERCKKSCPAGPFSTDYTLKCVQKHIYRGMVYLDMEKRRLAVKKFKIPSCCSCTLVN
ncbi:protein spaetzle 5-like [Vanessa cardui]|uniref:protein spaetzle 5-like n=1 Tax=Vanessa cardui TaxID=171605 RepID=UPI001F1441E5|nr:protein spaetzle 5-like [Vanessa cardui]